MTEEQRIRKRHADARRMAMLRGMGKLKRYRGDLGKEALRRARYYSKHRIHLLHADEMRKASPTQDEALETKRARLRQRYLARCQDLGIAPRY
jgi:hypothetical protein